MEWSFDLLAEDEQVAWRRLSTFAGSFDLQAAEAICGDDRLGSRAMSDRVAGLVDKSIVRREVHGDAARFRLLETIREYGRERLRDAGEEDVTSFRYRDWYVELAKIGRAHV